jgi:hypothetical protein
MKIQVIEKHITDGKRGSCTHDPVALSLLDAGFQKPWVSPGYLAWRFENKDYFQAIPENVLEFMKQFDNGQLVYPFDFEVDG